MAASYLGFAVRGSVATSGARHVYLLAHSSPALGAFHPRYQCWLTPVSRLQRRPPTTLRRGFLRLFALFIFVPPRPLFFYCSFSCLWCSEEYNRVGVIVQFLSSQSNLLRLVCILVSTPPLCICHLSSCPQTPLPDVFVFILFVVAFCSPCYDDFRGNFLCVPDATSTTLCCVHSSIVSSPHTFLLCVYPELSCLSLARLLLKSSSKKSILTSHTISAPLRCSPRSR